MDRRQKIISEIEIYQLNEALEICLMFYGEGIMNDVVEILTTNNGYTKKKTAGFFAGFPEVKSLCDDVISIRCQKYGYINTLFHTSIEDDPVGWSDDDIPI